MRGFPVPSQGLIATGTSGGTTLFAVGSVSAPGLALATETNTGFYSVASGTLSFASLGGSAILFGNSVFRVGSTYSIEWSSSTPDTFAADVKMVRDGVASLGIRNGTNAQTVSIYNTYTAGTPDYERLELKWSSNVASIGATKNGTGSTRTFQINFGASSTSALAVAGTLDVGVILGFNANNAGAAPTGEVIIGGNAVSRTATSNTTITAVINTSYSDGGTNSTTVVNCFAITPTINYTGASKTGKVYALYIKPTNTSLPTGQNAGIALSSTCSALNTGSALVFNNQADEDTNWEKTTFGYNANNFLINSTKGGTGTTRSINIAIAGTNIVQINGNGLQVGATTDQTIGVAATNGVNSLTFTLSGTLTGSPADFGIHSMSTALAGAFTVTRLNMFDIANVTGAATVTDMCLFRVNAAAGTHKMIDAGTTKTSPGTVTQWIKYNQNGTLAFIPSYSSKTS